MISPFAEEHSATPKIIGLGFLFYLFVIIVVVAVSIFHQAPPPPPPIPIFELVNVSPPPPPAPAPVKPRPEPVPQPAPPEPAPVPEPTPIPEPVPTPAPVPKPIPKPEPKPAPKPVPAPPVPAPPVEAPAEPVMEMPTMDLPMDLPKTKPLDMPALRVEGTVQMNSELKDYLARLQILLRGNFNPPAGETIAKGTKSSIAFTISRSGQISAVSLRASSGNGIWDRLAVRAVTITKAPPLPPSFLQEQLVMVYDFREK